MKCQRAQQRIMAYHDSELSDGAARRMEKHLESCEDCRQLLKDLRLADERANTAAGVNEVVGVPDMPPTDDAYWESFTARVLDRVEEDAATRAPAKRRTAQGWNLLVPKMAPAFSIALVVVVAAGVLIKMGEPMQNLKSPAPSMERPAGKDIHEDAREGISDGPVPAGNEYRKLSDGKDEGGTAGAAAGKDRDSTGQPFLQGGGSPDLPAEPENMEVPDKKMKAKASTTGPDTTVGRANGRPGTSAARASETKSGAVPTVVPDAEGDLTSGTPQTAASGTEGKRGLRTGGSVADEKPSGADRSEKEIGEVSALTLNEKGPPAPARTRAYLSPAAVGKEDQVPAAESSNIAGEHPEDMVPDDALSKQAAAEPASEPALTGREVVTPPPGTGTTVDGGDLETETGAQMENEPVSAVEGFLADTGPDGAMTAVPEPSGPGNISAPVTGALQETINKEAEQSAGIDSSAPAENIEESNIAGPADAQDRESASPGQDSRRAFSSGMPYRGPQDQLTHAKNLAEVRKFWESEQVLKDLLAQHPSSSIQQEASMLLVKVLTNQNRMVEAQHTLDDAKLQFPASDMIQTFEIRTNAGKPAQ